MKRNINRRNRKGRKRRIKISKTKKRGEKTCVEGWMC